MNQSIFRITESPEILENIFIDLSHSALISARKRSRVCFHESDSSDLHVMIVCLHPDSVIDVHSHNRSEFYYLLRGELEVLHGSDASSLSRFIMSPLTSSSISSSCFYMPAFCFHTMRALNTFAFYLEVVNGPFKPCDYA